MSCTQKKYYDTVIGCQDIRVNAVLQPNTPYVWEITSQLGNQYLIPFTTDSDGYGTIDVSQLPEGFCNAAGGFFTLKLKDSLESCEYIKIPFIVKYESAEIEMRSGTVDKSFIGCSYVVPSSGTFVTDRIQFVGDTGQATYQSDDLIDAVQVFVFAESGLMQEGAETNQYQFDSDAGEITFGQTVESQNITIIYFKRS